MRILRYEPHHNTAFSTHQLLRYSISNLIKFTLLKRREILRSDRLPINLNIKHTTPMVIAPIVAKKAIARQGIHLHGKRKISPLIRSPPFLPMPLAVLERNTRKAMVSFGLHFT